MKGNVQQQQKRQILASHGLHFHLVLGRVDDDTNTNCPILVVSIVFLLTVPLPQESPKLGPSPSTASKDQKHTKSRGKQQSIRPLNSSVRSANRLFTRRKAISCADLLLVYGHWPTQSAPNFTSKFQRIFLHFQGVFF